MIGSLMDRAYALRSRHGELPREVPAKSFSGDSSEQNWICFVPESVFKYECLVRRLVRGCGNGIAYLLPKTSIQPDPKKTRHFLDRVFEESAKLDLEGGVNVLGISLGNVLAYRFANQFPVGRLVSIVPGSRLAECAREGASTRSIVNNYGILFDKWQCALGMYDPISNLENMGAESLDVYLGGRDLIIPYSRGVELLDALDARGIDYKKKVYRFAGHVGTIVRALGDFASSSYLQLTLT